MRLVVTYIFKGSSPNRTHDRLWEQLDGITSMVQSMRDLGALQYVHISMKQMSNIIGGLDERAARSFFMQIVNKVVAKQGHLNNPLWSWMYSVQTCDMEYVICEAICKRGDTSSSE